MFSNANMDIVDLTGITDSDEDGDDNEEDAYEGDSDEDDNGDIIYEAYSDMSDSDDSSLPESIVSDTRRQPTHSSPEDEKKQIADDGKKKPCQPM